MSAYENHPPQIAPLPVKRMLRRKEVELRTGFSRPTLYRLIKQGRFPPSYSIGVRAVGWDEDEVNDWLMKRKEQPKVF